MGTKKYTKNNTCPNCKASISPQASFCKKHHRLHTAEWRAYFSSRMKGRTFTPEWKKKISLSKMGEKNCMKRPEIAIKVALKNKGKHLSEKHKRKLSAIFTGRIKTDEHLKHISEALKRAGIRPPPCPIERLRRGEKHYMWKGGITPLHEKIRSSPECSQWKKDCLKRDNFTCQWCRQKHGKLEVDHIKMFSHYPELRFELSNGKTLCINCHAWKTRMDRKIYLTKLPIKI